MSEPKEEVTLRLSTNAGAAPGVLRAIADGIDSKPLAVPSEAARQQVIQKLEQALECVIGSFAEELIADALGLVRASPSPLFSSADRTALRQEIAQALDEDGFSGGPDKRRRDGRMTCWCPECSSGDDEGHDEDCRWLRDHGLLRRCLAVLQEQEG